MFDTTRILGTGLLMTMAVAAMPGPAKGATVTITRADCTRLTQHVPSAGVAYQPGVDVNGRAAAPADLNGGQQIAVPENFAIEIDVDLLESLGIPTAGALHTPEAKIGVVEVRGGRAYFNGQPLQNEAQADLAKNCRALSAN